MTQSKTDSVLQILLRGGTGAEVETAFASARAKEREHRKEELIALGASQTSSAPAATLYHQESKITPQYWPSMSTPEAVEHTLALDYRRYPDAPTIALENAPLESELGRILATRRSVRRFSERSATRTELSTLLQMACGVTDHTDVVPRRSYPSGGALYPIEVYPLCFRVDGLECGAYHYRTLDHVLEKIGPLTGYDEVHHAAPQLVREAQPALMIVLTLALERTAAKYMERGYRFGLLEAGHIAQNVLLVASALGIDSVCIGGFFDDDMNSILRLNAQTENVVYAVLLGRR